MDEPTPKIHKLKAIDINTESLKLYITIAVASIAGLIAFHNSTTIEHNEIAFKVTLAAFVLSAIMSVVTLNTYIISVDNEEIEVTAKLPVWLNRIAIGLFMIGLLSAGFYLGLSKPKTQSQVQTSVKELSGIIIQGDRIEIGNDVKTHIRISRDSAGVIREITIPNQEK